VPVHLLTQEAFSIYLERLKTNGVLVINISNRIVDLRRAVEGNARHFQLSLAHINHYPGPTRWWELPSQWLLLAPHRNALEDSQITDVTDINDPDDLHGAIWTDEFSSILPILRWPARAILNSPEQSLPEQTANRVRQEPDVGSVL